MIKMPPHSQSAGLPPPADKPVFAMKRLSDQRINGSMPVWDSSKQASTASASTESKWTEEFSRTLEQQVKSAETPPAVPKDALGFQSSAKSEKPADNNDSFGFFDFLDIINPLQHIPIISTIYRHITGDEMGAVAKIVGGAVYGGPIGVAVGAADAIVTHETGKDMGENLVGMLDGSTIAIADLTRTRSPYNS